MPYSKDQYSPAADIKVKVKESLPDASNFALSLVQKYIEEECDDQGCARASVGFWNKFDEYLDVAIERSKFDLATRIYEINEFFPNKRSSLSL